MKILIGCLIGAAVAATAEPPSPTANGGRCSIQPSFTACQICCEVDRRVAGVLDSACRTGTVVAGARLAGPYGSGFGRFIGGLICQVMFDQTTCEDRCVGKDGDPLPIACTSAIDDDEIGVCRQVCEQGQHDLGPGTCPTGYSVDMRCCVDEYDAFGDDDCPEHLCPGAFCPAGCANGI